MQLNTVGDEASRAAYRQGLQEFLEPQRQDLTPDSQRRLQTNPLRILDTKDPGERDLLVNAPQLVDYLTEDSRTHFDTVQAILGQNDLSFRVEPRLVRGLDYYTRTVFEIVSEGLGAQDAIVGGGRYDRLVEELGGQPLPAIGFAIGEDRLIDVLPRGFAEKLTPAAPISVVAAGNVTADEALAIAESLRGSGLDVAAELGPRSVKAALKRAHRSGSRWVVLIGDDEVENGTVTIRDLESAEQSEVSREELADYLRGFE